MKTIQITGTFTDSVNNLAIVDLFSLNSTKNPYDVRKTFNKDFVFEIHDLNPDSIYILDVTGFTFGTFELNIVGDIPKNIKDTFKKTDFSPGYKIKTTP